MNTVKRYSGFLAWFAALLLVAMAAGCGGGSEGRDPILGVGAGTGGVGVGGGGCLPGVIAKDITAYTFPTSTATVIDQVLKTIAVTVPNGTNVTALVATFTTTGTGVTVPATGLAQVSGVTPNNFTLPVVYRVTAGDCSTVDYTVTVTVAPAAPVASCAGPGPVDMGLATSFGVLVGPAGGATLTVTNPTSVTGDVGAASYVPATGPSTVVGTQYTGVDAPYVAAKADMLTAIGCASGRLCTANYGVATDFATVVGLAPGVHCVTGAMSVGSNLVLSIPGVYIFKSSGALTSANNINLTFGVGVNDTNTSLFWVPTGPATIGSGNAFKGTIMPDASAATTLGATTTLLPGRAFSNSDVVLNTNTIAIP